MKNRLNVERFQRVRQGRGTGGTTRLKIAVGGLSDRSNGESF